MAEAEDVLTDAARHATEYAQGLWRRHRPARRAASAAPPATSRAAWTCCSSPCSAAASALRVAQPPAPPHWLARWAAATWLAAPAGRTARHGRATSIWLPAFRLRDSRSRKRWRSLRLQALRQAMRAVARRRRRLVRCMPDPLAARPAPAARGAGRRTMSSSAALPGVGHGSGAPATRLPAGARRRSRPAAGAAPHRAARPRSLMRRARSPGSRLPRRAHSRTLPLPASAEQVLDRLSGFMTCWRRAGCEASRAARSGATRGPAHFRRHLPGRSGRRPARPAETDARTRRPPRRARLARRPEVREAEPGRGRPGSRAPGWCRARAAERSGRGSRWACSARPTATRPPPPRSSRTRCPNCPRRGW